MNPKEGYVSAATRDGIYTVSSGSAINKLQMPPLYEKLPITCATFNGDIVTVAFESGHVCMFRADYTNMVLIPEYVKQVEGFKPTIVQYGPTSNRLLIAGTSPSHMRTGVVMQESFDFKPVTKTFPQPVRAADIHDLSSTIVVATGSETHGSEIHTLHHDDYDNSLKYAGDVYQTKSPVLSVHLNEDIRDDHLAVGMDGKVEILSTA